MADATLDLDTIFCGAIEIASPEERAAHIARACGPDLGLRERINKLVAAHFRAGSFLEMPAPTPSTAGELQSPALEASATPGELPGTLIGPYKLLQKLGEGGMGTVFMAEQTRPVQRRVALKLIKAGMDSAQVLARFEAERQALAMMDHVNIARVLDAGAAESGRPYFVMELVHGVPITKYCDDNHLTPRERLELFVPVCQAIQHAHQKGIIHRDVKPSNVMITLYDGRPVPKVIDFGVAKATEQRLTERTLFTQYGTMVGTLEYMSPEQAEMSALGVDTRSDIFSLGVLLYELLTGSTPLSRKRVKEAAYGEVLRMIREEEPPRPSTRLSDSGEALASISAQRHMEPAKLTKLMRGELDWIVMKCLEKDRNRRYATANGFAADVQRYLNDQPVQACPPSAMYRFRKFARRNRRTLTMTSVLALAMLLMVGSVGWMVRDRAAAAEQVARDNAGRLALLEGRISQALDEAEAHYELDKLPEAISSVKRADALLASDNGVSNEIRQRVDQWRAELTILQRLEDLGFLPFRKQSRKTDAAYSQVFFDIGINIDEMPVEEAGRRIRSCLTWKRLTEALDRWGGVRHEMIFVENPSPDAHRHKQRLLQVARAADADELRSQARLAVEKWDLKAAEHLAESPTTVSRLAASTLRQLAMVIYWGGGESRRESAVRLLVNAQIQRPGDFQLNAACANYYMQMDPPRWAEAAHYWSVALAIRPEDAGVQERIGWSYANEAKFDEAFAHYSKAIELDPKRVGAWINRGYAYRQVHQYEKALADFSKAIELEPRLAMAWCNRGLAYLGMGQPQKGLPDFSKAIELDPNLAAAWSNRGLAYDKLGQLDRAITEYSKAIELDPKDPMPWNNRSDAYRGLGQLANSLADSTKAIELDPKFALAWFNRGTSYMLSGQLEMAIADYSRGLELAPNNTRANNDLAWLYATCPNPKLRHPGRAVELAKKAVGLAPKEGDLWNTLAVAHYRTGDWQSAIKALEKSIELRKGGDSFDWFFLAMAHAKLGNKGEDRKWYDKAVEWMEKNKQQLEKNALQREELQRFHAEAKDVLDRKDPSSSNK
jgi:eukaryotic-like serine/threonine-protein kinase